MAESKDTPKEISPASGADLPKKSNRGGRRKNQTGRPPSAIKPKLTREQLRRLNALARHGKTTPTKLVEEQLAKWLDADSVGEDADQIERWERFEKSESEGKKGKLPPKRKSTSKKLPASKIKVYR